MSFKPDFSRFLGSQPARLHFAAHSHHPWPDVSFDAQQQAWLDAAEYMDAKWDKIFGEVIPAAQAHLARHLKLPDPATICFAHNTHEFLVRLISSIETQPFRVLTTDSEFHSFARQLRRLEEAGRCEAVRVPVEPYASFAQRFAAAAAQGGHHLVFFSQVFFNSGYVVQDLAALVAAVPSARALIVIDGYHGFMALPTELARLAERVFYLGGGYKYAMAGEGVGYLHCPPGYALRPLMTGWFAGFGHLSATQDGAVPYAPDGMRFMGATFDPTGLYRFNAVMRWAEQHQLTPARVHAQVQELQSRFLQGLDGLRSTRLCSLQLQPPVGHPRGNFLSFRLREAGEFYRQLLRRQVVTDYRDDRLRIGFGIYHDEADVAELLRRLREVLDS